MARETLPINPTILAWARIRSGLSLDDVAERLPRYPDWESGAIFPTYPQLETLADTFKIPIAIFFFPEPPDLPAIEETFRTLPGEEIEQLPSRIRLLLRKGRAFQLNLAELTNERNPAENLITKELAFSSDVEDLAHRVRTYLDVSLEEQRSWADSDTALKAWRQALVDVGVFVFKDVFKIPEYSGFCLYDETFPIIYVNNSSTRTRQMFTLFHELAHLLF